MRPLICFEGGELSADTAGSPQSEMRAALLREIAGFRLRLIDFSRSNRLLFYRDLKTRSLRLQSLGTPAVAKLLDGSSLRLSEIVGESDNSELQDRAIAREIRLRAKANEEERGLQTLFVALGFAKWPAPDGGRPVMAPVLLLPVELKEANRPGLEPLLSRAGDLQPNRVLLAYVKDQYRIEIDDEALTDEGGEAVQLTPWTIGHALREIPDLEIELSCALGNFDFQKMAMVNDLEEQGELIAQNELIAALTGDAIAQSKIAEAQRFEFDATKLDEIPARDEYFVLDTDSSQQLVLHTLLKSESHGVIQGPPGTGKSQTIANLIASLIGNGERVLFVAEKRAALDAVLKRLTKVGLGHLVLDLHGADVKRRKIYDRLRAADQAARLAQRTNHNRTLERFEILRRRLNEHSQAINEERPLCGMSVFELIGTIAAIPDQARCDARLSRPTVDRLGAEQFGRVKELVRQASALGPIFARDLATPWAQCEFETAPAAAEAIETAIRLDDAFGVLREKLLSLTGGSHVKMPTAWSDTEQLAAALSAAIAVSGIFRESLADCDVVKLVDCVSPHQLNTLTRAFAFLNREFRQSMRELRRHARKAAKPRELYHEAARFLALPLEWRDAMMLERCASPEAIQTLDLIRQTLRERTALKQSKALVDEQLVTSEIGLKELVRTRMSANRVVQARAAERELRAVGFEPFLRELIRNPRPPDTWLDVAEGIWANSHLEGLIVEDPRIAQFDRLSHEEAIREFRSLDEARLQLAADEIRRSAAESYFEAKRTFTAEDVSFQQNLLKKIKQLPLRKLMTAAPHVTTALCPCWMASPLSVSQLIDPKADFDVVIFDEASQVLPQDAVTSIIRGRRTIVAGDRHQLPPTTFFSTSDTEDDERDGDLAATGIESILDLMSICVEPRSLRWHYRSRDERLIAFSNEWIYKNELVTFPGIEEPPPAIVHVLCDPVGSDVEDESTSVEVRRVVELVFEHATTRPRESLGVIAMGIKHAMRIDAALYEARRQRPDLDEFFQERGDDSFFCKNLERVQGDERDAIILSVGYGKDRSGRMFYRFGPITNAGGERRLNVAITRARRRITVVSSIGSNDMDDKRLTSEGPRLLKRYIRYAETSGRNLSRDGQRIEIAPNPFELDIQNALAARGVSTVAQWGVSSYRIDLAAQHPEHPGQFVMAIECDGATYHSAQTARDRDRIRQNQLEAMGWKFHRIWSTDWFANRAAEIERAVKAYEAAAARVESDSRPINPAGSREFGSSGTEPQTRPARRGRRPGVRTGLPIDSYSTIDLCALCRWVLSDGLLREDDAVVREVAEDLGFTRVGSRIKRRLLDAVEEVRDE